MTDWSLWDSAPYEPVARHGEFRPTVVHSLHPVPAVPGRQDARCGAAAVAEPGPRGFAGSASVRSWTACPASPGIVEGSMRKTITTAVLVLAAAALAGPAHADSGDNGAADGGDLTAVGGKAASYLCALTSATGATTGAGYFSCSGNMPVHL